jgi:hypothetical protein
LANLFYWIDRKNGFGGFWATLILPFGDPVSFGRYIDFETALYNSLRQRNAAWRPETVRPLRRAAVDSVQPEQSPFRPIAVRMALSRQMSVVDFRR